MAEEHAWYREVVFQRLRDKKLYANGEKVDFVWQKIEVSGHAVTRDGIGPDIKKIKAIQDWNRHLTQKGLGHSLAKSTTTTGSCEIFLRLLGLCPTCWRKAYPKNGMNLVTKPLGSSKASCLCHPWSSFHSLINLLRCMQIWVIILLPECWCKIDGSLHMRARN